jgi:predicted phage terminase large subunit-like protein
MYSSNKKKMWLSVKYKAHNEDMSKLLWPSRRTKEFFINLKQGFVDQGMPDMYSQEYLNYPIDESNSYFKRDDFLPIEGKIPYLNYYAAADFAVSKKDRADYTVLAVVGVDSKGILHVVDIRRGRWDALEIVEEMFNVHKRYDPQLFIVEQGTIHNSIRPFLDMEMVKRRDYIRLHPMTPTKDKITRARSLQARLRSGGVRFDKEAQWWLTLEDELIKFPKDRHDDQVDALSWIGLALDQVVDAPTTQELQEDEWEEMEHDFFSPQGISSVTGY